MKRTMGTHMRNLRVSVYCLPSSSCSQRVSLNEQSGSKLVESNGSPLTWWKYTYMATPWITLVRVQAMSVPNQGIASRLKCTMIIRHTYVTQAPIQTDEAETTVEEFVYNTPKERRRCQYFSNQNLLEDT